MCLIAHDESDFACAHDIIDFMYGLTLALSYLLCLFDNSVDLVDIPAARIAIVYQYTEGENTLDYRRIKYGTHSHLNKLAPRMAGRLGSFGTISEIGLWRREAETT